MKKLSNISLQILDFIKERRSVRTSDLYKIRKYPSIHLTRLKEKGLIHSPFKGVWRYGPGKNLDSYILKQKKFHVNTIHEAFPEIGLSALHNRLRQLTVVGKLRKLKQGHYTTEMQFSEYLLKLKTIIERILGSRINKHGSTARDVFIYLACQFDFSRRDISRACKVSEYTVIGNCRTFKQKLKYRTDLQNLVSIVITAIDSPKCKHCDGTGYAVGGAHGVRRDVKEQVMTHKGVFDLLECKHRRLALLDRYFAPINSSRRTCYACPYSPKSYPPNA